MTMFFAVLGIHRDKGSKNVFIRAWQPHAGSIEVLDRQGNSCGMMDCLDQRGFFLFRSPSASGENFSYRFKIENDRGEVYEAEDTYRFQPTLGRY